MPENTDPELANILQRMTEVDGRMGDLARIAIRKVGQLEKQLAELKKENEELQDENESLWFMLDEMKESQKFSKEHSDYMEEFIKKQMLQIKLMQNNKGDA